MKNNSTTLLFLAGAFVLFVIVKILPKFKSAPTHTTGRIEQADDLKSNYSFKQDGSAWIISDGGDTLSEIKIEIASTLSQIDTGLKYRKTLKTNNGLLFIFETMEHQSFWMKNTFIPLDLLMMDQNGIIIQINEGMKPKSVEPINSSSPIKYALEVNKGFVANNQIRKGSKLTFEKNK